MSFRGRPASASLRHPGPHAGPEDITRFRGRPASASLRLRRLGSTCGTTRSFRGRPASASLRPTSALLGRSVSPSFRGRPASASLRPSKAAAGITAESGAVSEAGRPRLHCGRGHHYFCPGGCSFPRPAGLGFIAAAPRPRLPRCRFGVSEAGRPRLHCGNPNAEDKASPSPKFPRPAGLGFIAAVNPAVGGTRECGRFPSRPASASLRRLDQGELDDLRDAGVSEAGRPRLHCGSASTRSVSGAPMFPRPAGLGFIAADAPSVGRASRRRAKSVKVVYESTASSIVVTI